MTGPDDAAAPACWRLVAHGRVQGVGYRDACVHAARAIGVAGWVRNRADGSVEVQACADHAVLERFARWMRRGPSLARVDELTIVPEAVPQPPPTAFVRQATR
jgi:acylphosphatase